jgi:Na+/H+ antiporter NhaD/arsenite permease-like protein
MKRLINAAIATIWWFYTLPGRYDVERRNSVKYKKKKELVKNTWIVASVVIISLLQYPILAGLSCCVALAITFIGFMILDETE